MKIMALLHNRVSNEELKQRLMEEPFPRTTISFYQYFPIQNPQEFRDFLYKNLNAIQVFGRIYVANEGKLLAFVARDEAEAVLEAMRAHPLGRSAAIIGEVSAEHPGMVVARTSIGGTRVVDTQVGEQLPRIC